MEYIPKVIKAHEKKKILENFFSLTTLQGVNSILPVIVLFYLIRVIGPEKFGLIAFAQALIQYFLIVTDYGFNLTATRRISVFRDQKRKVWQIFSAVMSVKLILSAVSFLILVAIVYFIPRFSLDPLVYLLSFGVVIGNTLFPVWYLQGTEKMKYIAVINIVCGILYTASILLLVKSPANYLDVPALTSLFSVISGLLGFYITIRKFKVKFVTQRFEKIKEEFTEGWDVFVSIVAINAYTATRTFAVGLLTNNIITGYYSIAERIANFVQTFPLYSLSQAVYPKISKIFADSEERALKLMRKIQNTTIAVYSLVLPAAFLLAPWIVWIFCGREFKEVILATRILLVSVFFIVSNTFRVQFLLVIERPDIYSKIHVAAAIIGLPLIFILIYFFSYVGAACSTIILEAGIFAATYYVVKKLKIFS
jgi:PST family polysaccharide transporter